jgi:putative FmdB family regulatory protein
MPFYEYRCDTCGHEMEIMQKMSDPPVAECPACGEPNLRKLVSAAGFRLKGGGWYETDFKKGGKKNVHDSGGGKESSAAPACGAGACSACQS